jgi:hypothetical protein
MNSIMAKCSFGSEALSLQERILTVNQRSRPVVLAAATASPQQILQNGTVHGSPPEVRSNLSYLTFLQSAILRATQNGGAPD